MRNEKERGRKQWKEERRFRRTHVLSWFSCVWLFGTPWTIACQAPLSMGFSRQESWSGLPFLSPGDLSNPGIEPRSPALQMDSLPAEPTQKPHSLSHSATRARDFNLYRHQMSQQGGNLVMDAIPWAVINSPEALPLCSVQIHSIFIGLVCQDRPLGDFVAWAEYALSFFKLLILYCSVVGKQCCISFKCTA